MSQVQGVVISFTPLMKAKKQDGGQYDAWELVYRNSQNEVKDITKPAQGLKFNPDLKTALSSLKAGDEFTALMEKNERGYLEVKSVEKGIKEVQEVAPTVATANDGNRAVSRGGKVLGSTYETPEERAKKQVIITRQAAVNAAIEYARLNNVVAEHPFTVEDILGTAKDFEKHYNKDLDKAAKKYLALDLSKDE